MKTRYLALLIIMLCALYTPLVNSTEFELNVEHMPYEGDSNTPIVMFITTTPFSGAKPRYLYVFWDSIPIKDNIADVNISDSAFEHRWRFSFLPPKARSNKGSHAIQVWVYDHEGTIGKHLFYYNIKGIVPQLEWWDDLPPAFIDELTGSPGATGSQGPQGTTGASGSQGIPGTTGPKGNTGSTGPRGEEGQQGAIGLQGPIGEPGMSGVDGVDGVDGKAAPTLWLIVSLVLSLFSAISAILLIRGRK